VSSASDAWWEERIAEAEAAGGTVEVDLAEVPQVPGMAVCLPSARAGAGKRLDLKGTAGVYRLTVRPARASQAP
jgi:hypothetical protein